LGRRCCDLDHQTKKILDRTSADNSGLMVDRLKSLDRTRQSLGPGESLIVCRGTPHYFRNGHEEETLFTAPFRPGQQFLRFFLNMTLGTANHAEWYDARGEPLALHAYSNHGYAAGIPVWFQKGLFVVLTPIALLRGYRLAIPPRR
jgi:hypothetical protein